MKFENYEKLRKANKKKKVGKKNKTQSKSKTKQKKTPKETHYKQNKTKERKREKREREKNDTLLTRLIFTNDFSHVVIYLSLCYLFGAFFCKSNCFL